MSSGSEGLFYSREQTESAKGQADIFLSLSSGLPVRLHRLAEASLLVMKIFKGTKLKRLSLCFAIYRYYIWHIILAE